MKKGDRTERAIGADAETTELRKLGGEGFNHQNCKSPERAGKSWKEQRKGPSDQATREHWGKCRGAKKVMEGGGGRGLTLWRKRENSKRKKKADEVRAPKGRKK